MVYKFLFVRRGTSPTLQLGGLGLFRRRLLVREDEERIDGLYTRVVTRERGGFLMMLVIPIDGSWDGQLAIVRR
jgi:hypothetical protein